MAYLFAVNFQSTQEASDIRALAHKFAKTEISPLVSQDEQSMTFRPEWIEKMGQLGLTGIPVSQDYGGAGLGYQEYICLIEELASVSLTYAVSVAVSGLTQLVIEKYGTDIQKKQYLPALTSGQAIGSFALSEPGSGSDAGALRTTAKKTGSHYVLNGTKMWITQGDIASTFVLMARTGDAGKNGISTFVLSKGTPGLSVGKKETKMGMNSSHTVELILQDVKIPTSSLIGQEGMGLKIALSALDGGRVTMGAAAIGLGQAALNLAASYANERYQFGRPIGDFQGISFLLADLATRLESSKLLVEKAAWQRDQGQNFTQAASMAKLFATDTAMEITTQAVQILGGVGYTTEFPAERYMREAKVLQIVEGTNQIQRLVIGKNILKEHQKRS